MSQNGYRAIMARKNEIIELAVGINYKDFDVSPITFNYEALMAAPGYTIEDAQKIQKELGVGSTPLLELRNITALVRSFASPGKGARIFLKDERSNPSGSFKDRRASISLYHAARLGFKGVVAATSGNYGAAVAAQAAKLGLKAIIIQEVFDSRGVGQPEILEKSRACEAYGAEVWQMTVGPELFYMLLRMLEETGFYSASLYTPTSVLGIETLGWEIATQVKERAGKFPDAVIVTHSGGGNVTGTARGFKKAGATSSIIGASVDLRGLHMASDIDFNRKSFTTGHTGFGVPFLTQPDRTDVPRNSARGLRYLDRYVLVRQGDVFYVTELLSKIEGLERGPAGNISLTAALAIAREMDRDQIVVVQETEYTTAGKLPTSQLTFARANGIEVCRGDPRGDCPGKRIIIPENIGQIEVDDFDMNQLRHSFVYSSLRAAKRYRPQAFDWKFLAEDSKSTTAFVMQAALKTGDK